MEQPDETIEAVESATSVRMASSAANLMAGTALSREDVDNLAIIFP